MSALELKGGMIEMIANINNEEALQHLFDFIADMLTQDSEGIETLTPEQEALLDQDLKDSLDPANLIDHEEVIKSMRK